MHERTAADYRCMLLDGTAMTDVSVISYADKICDTTANMSEQKQSTTQVAAIFMNKVESTDCPGDTEN